MFNPDPAAYLPHRNPFLFLDRLTDLKPGVSASATLNLTSDVAGRPAFLHVEAMAQLGGIAAATEEGGGGILAAIDRAEFHAVPAQGDHLVVQVRIVKSFPPLHMVEGSVTAGDRVLSAATITLRVGKLI